MKIAGASHGDEINIEFRCASFQKHPGGRGKHLMLLPGDIKAGFQQRDQRAKAEAAERGMELEQSLVNCRLDILGAASSCGIRAESSRVFCGNTDSDKIHC